MDVERARRRVGLAAATGVIVLAVIGFAAFELAGHASPGSPANGTASSTAVRNVAASSGTAPSAAAASASGLATPTASPGASAAKSSAATTAPTTSPSAAASAGGNPQAVELSAVSAAAFGPNGTADGDNPQLAGAVLTNPASGWMTDWYASAEFGSLKQGTGLLLDMGKNVTISSVQVRLGTATGASIELLTGTQPAMSAFRLAAAQQDVGGLVTLTPARSATARYVVLWFTKLPPDGNGTYQASVHQVAVKGQP